MNESHPKNFVGSIEIQVKDEIEDISFPVLIQYPTLEPSTVTAFGPYKMDISREARITEGRFPLVIISHGNGGSHLLYRTISTHLAKNGYVVGMLEHYGNNRNNNELENTTKNLVYRPRHVSLTIDAILSSKRFGASLLSNRIAVLGHSMGGYTALALAGGVPWTKEGKKIEAPSDPRVKAIVLMAPGAGWFMNSLGTVTVPILIFMAEHDPITPSWNAEVVLNSVPDRSHVTLRTIKNAGHFSFLSPFPTAMKNPNFRPSIDPEGFDREQFHKQLPVDILDFLNDKLMRRAED
ncbi:alpha/beta hydrolase family protein [Leptospira inadai serovar Lyme str. 10]|uniref:Alpha/beta hydrolase family protein n=2 Tax=Leptospira inadai serovar Lyme TaxID=293084 RepID=V6HZV6_9LEPT|nr:alpha/beta fold hydrolase [Leptospira inadai]EQA38544.1 alpha/beta hydrolase family protein [Leptospira inadai serovar Lyme str. 10]PNV72640.1 alpha/beta hydrolase [Leptospira inadai serovar Lyme]